MEIEFGSLLVRFCLMFARIAAFVLAIPFLSRLLSLRLRLTWAGLMSFALAMPLTSSAFSPKEPLLFLGLQEVILGITFGIFVSLLLHAAQVSGSWVSRLSGGSLAFQSTFSGQSPFSTLFLWFAVGIFFSVGGHRDVIDVVLVSFEKLPVGAAWDVTRCFEFLIQVLTASTEFAIRFVFPILLSIVLSGVFTAILAKFISYFGFFAIGITVNASITLIALLMLLATMGATMHRELTESLHSIREFTELLIR